jgi:uncharacterized repeat protein (TIGR01451 family)
MKLETWKSKHRPFLVKVILVAVLLLIPLTLYALAAPETKVHNLEIASVGSGGVRGNGGSFYVYTSADGRYVTFESLADNWRSGISGLPNWVDIFVRDRMTNTTVQATVSTSGGKTDESSYDPSMSADGRYVAYFSYASDLVPNDTNGSDEGFRDGLDVFLYDTHTRRNRRVSLTADGKQIIGNSVGSISPDGQYILFVSNGRVVKDSAAEEVRSALYLRDWQSGTVRRVSRAVDGGYPNSAPLEPSISLDNRYIVYSSEATNLVPGDWNRAMDVFLYDRQLGTTRLISRAQSGGQSNGLSSQGKIAHDGQTIVFRSFANNLVAGDTNGVADIFVYDMATGKISRVSMAENGAQANGMSRDASVCGNGRFISYTTEANNLTPGDVNNDRDVILYDREKGTNTIVTVNQDGIYGNKLAHRSFVTPDCRMVAFASDASNLVPGDTNNHRDIFIGDIYLPADFSESAVGYRGTAEPGEVITYTFRLDNDGYESSTAILISKIPTNTTYLAGSASDGAAYDDVANQLEWQFHRYELRRSQLCSGCGTTANRGDGADQ